MTKFNQNHSLKPYIDINIDLKKEAKNNFEKSFLNWWIAMENLRKHNFVTTEKRSNYLVSEPNLHTKKFFPEKLLALKMKKLRYLWINLST